MKKNAFVLLEVLFSMSLIALIFLSLLFCNMRVLHREESLNLQSIALSQCMNAADMLLANHTKTSQKKVLKMWNTENAVLLPDGLGSMHHKKHYFCSVKIQWHFHEKKSLSYQVVCP